jgi:hypothetical protein
MRATLMPAAIMRCSCSTALVPGPIVHTIVVLTGIESLAAESTVTPHTLTLTLTLRSSSRVVAGTADAGAADATRRWFAKWPARRPALGVSDAPGAANCDRLALTARPSASAPRARNQLNVCAHFLFGCGGSTHIITSTHHPSTFHLRPQSSFYRSPFIVPRVLVMCAGCASFSVSTTDLAVLMPSTRHIKQPGFRHTPRICLAAQATRHRIAVDATL